MKPSANLSFWRSTAAVIAILSIFGITVAPGAFAQGAYWVTDLGSLGGNGSYATCINNSGQVAGNSEITNYSSIGTTHAFLWSAGGMTDLGTLDGGSSYATSINNSGQVAGYISTTNSGYEAFLYTGVTMTGLYPATLTTSATGINGAAQVVGNFGSGGYIAGFGGFLFSAGMGGGIDILEAYGINDSGLVAGVSSDHLAVIFNAATGAKTYLGTLGGAGGSTTPSAINQNGQVAGGGHTSSAYNSQTHAFLWSSGIMTDLGTLGGYNSWAYGINNDGQVVGRSSRSTTNNSDAAFLYSGGNMTDLNNLIPASPGWTLTQANAINGSGQIVGFGFNPSGQTHAFLLTPVPVPHRATASAVVSNGVVANITVTDRGFGYTNPPIVLIQGGGDATATAVVSNGVVVNIVITDAGVGYTSTPSIYIYSPFGLQVGLLKAVQPSFTDLFLGTNYQLQVSSDLSNWTNQGSPFTATNPALAYPQYWNVDNWNQLFFRLEISP